MHGPRMMSPGGESRSEWRMSGEVAFIQPRAIMYRAVMLSRRVSRGEVSCTRFIIWPCHVCGDFVAVRCPSPPRNTANDDAQARSFHPLPSPPTYLLVPTSTSSPHLTFTLLHDIPPRSPDNSPSSYTYDLSQPFIDLPASPRPKLSPRTVAAHRHIPSAQRMRIKLQDRQHRHHM